MLEQKTTLHKKDLTRKLHCDKKIKKSERIAGEVSTISGRLALSTTSNNALSLKIRVPKRNLDQNYVADSRPVIPRLPQATT